MDKQALGPSINRPIRDMAGCSQLFTTKCNLSATFFGMKRRTEISVWVPEAISEH